MLSAYERHLILFYLSNAFSRLRSRDEEAKNLLRWLRKHEDQLEIPYPHTAGDDAEGAVGHKLPDEEVPTLEWRRVGKALRNALAAARQARPDRTATRLRRLAKATRLSRTDTAILELMLHCNTASLVGSMIDDIGDNRHWSRSCVNIAYGLARVAVGDGVAAFSLNSPEGLDYAGGHALLRGAGAVLLDETGREGTYSREGTSHVAGCFGGAPKAARTLAMRSWPSRQSALSSRPTVALSWPRAVEDDAVDRAKGLPLRPSDRRQPRWVGRVSE